MFVISDFSNSSVYFTEPAEAFSRAWFKSSIKSSTFSIPTDKRTKSALTPAVINSSSFNC